MFHLPEGVPVAPGLAAVGGLAVGVVAVGQAVAVDVFEDLAVHQIVQLVSQAGLDLHGLIGDTLDQGGSVVQPLAADVTGLVLVFVHAGVAA